MPHRNPIGPEADTPFGSALRIDSHLLSRKTRRPRCSSHQQSRFPRKGTCFREYDFSSHSAGRSDSPAYALRIDRAAGHPRWPGHLWAQSLKLVRGTIGCRARVQHLASWCGAIAKPGWRGRPLRPLHDTNGDTCWCFPPARWGQRRAGGAAIKPPKCA